MICCDNCDGWYHGDCMGITPDMDQEMEDDNKEYISPDTTLVSSASVGIHLATSSVIHLCELCVHLQWEIKMVKHFAS